MDDDVPAAYKIGGGRIQKLHFYQFGMIDPYKGLIYKWPDEVKESIAFFFDQQKWT